MQFFATCPLGFGDLLEAEIVAAGGRVTTRAVAGAGFEGDLACGYRLCLWSRIANRVLAVLAEFDAPDGDALYDGCRAVDWCEHVDADGSIAVDFTTTRSALKHTLFGAQRTKDAVVDRLRVETGRRPSVDVLAPDVRINVHVERDRASLSIDLAGDSLHRRGYRLAGGVAPIKENLAAGLLVRAGWPEIARRGGAFIDPMCGSGTFAIEALMMAADIAPGFGRSTWGFRGWRQHDDACWHTLVEEARSRRTEGLAHAPRVVGSDRSDAAVETARGNAERAGLAGLIEFTRCELADATPPAATGLIVTNPPYGERLEETDLGALFATFGDVLRSRFDGWRAAILTPDEALGFRTGLRIAKKNKARNGPIDVWLLTFDVAAERTLRPRTPDPGIEDVSNRLRKNARHFARWAETRGVTCYRVYDADLPDYAFAIDVYRGAETWLHVQEYAPPATVDEARAERRRTSLADVLPALFDVPAANVFMKTRRRQRAGAQYERHADVGIFHEIEEGGCRFLVNFTDYLDTGLFLDHRPLRMRIQAESRAKRFLNLFAYTATATVHAARGGAQSSVSVDLSNTYVDWARRNLRLNGVDEVRHRVVRSDCRDWLGHAARKGERFDLVLLDPPSFSKSKSGAGVLNVQRDHVALVRAVMDVLAPDGTLYFSNNFQQFRLDAAAFEDLDVVDISANTLDEDFRRNPRIHKAWRIRRR
jgi:23S rRNA (guanine2445-N2)-methyltransferase / 23S rRNA (guanine2069-N7)-methyltransferase